MKRKALFLDRDGVINVDHGYVHKPENFEFTEGIFDLCRTAKQHGYLLIVITNQAGIARGYYTEDTFHSLTNWMLGVFEGEDCAIDKVYYSPYHPTHGLGRYKRHTNCRKPMPGMIYRAMRDFDIDPQKSILVGDKTTDIQAGIASRVKKNILVHAEPHKKRGKTSPIQALTLEQIKALIKQGEGT